MIPEIPGVKEAYLGLIPAPVFITILTDEGGQIAKSLFYDNVRDWQDFNAVNSEMRETLESEVQRSRFALMNNGITIIAKTLRATGNKFYIEDFQIVNGCQTSHVLFSQRDKLTDESVMVPLRLISTQDEDITAAIIKATNRQTEVKGEQLLAISNFQKKLELFFQTFDDENRLFYERRSRQYNNMPGIEKTRIVLPSALIRVFSAMFLDQAHRTTRNYKALVDQVEHGYSTKNTSLSLTTSQRSPPIGSNIFSAARRSMQDLSGPDTKYFSRLGCWRISICRPNSTRMKWSAMQRSLQISFGISIRLRSFLERRPRSLIQRRGATLTKTM